MKNPPSISVLMACRNARPYLEASLRSIANQVFRNWEMVVVDDASDDGSSEILEQWAGREPRIHLLRNSSRMGQTASLNRGLAEVRAPWTARQDADDLSHPLRLQRQWEAVTACPELILLGTAGRMIDANDRLCGLLDVPSTSRLISRAACFLNPFLHTAVAFRTEVVRERLRGYNENFSIAQDYELWSRMLGLGPVANLQARLVAYRHLGTSLSKAGRSQAFDEASQVARKHAETFYPGLLDAGDWQALTSFREGTLFPAALPALLRAWKKLRLAKESGGCHFVAALHLRAAGSLLSQSPAHALFLLMRAMANAPTFTASWLAERFRLAPELS